MCLGNELIPDKGPDYNLAWKMAGTSEHWEPDRVHQWHGKHANWEHDEPPMTGHQLKHYKGHGHARGSQASARGERANHGRGSHTEEHRRINAGYTREGVKMLCHYCLTVGHARPRCPRRLDGKAAYAVYAVYGYRSAGELTVPLELPSSAQDIRPRIPAFYDAKGDLQALDRKYETDYAGIKDCFTER